MNKKKWGLHLFCFDVIFACVIIESSKLCMYLDKITKSYYENDILKYVNSVEVIFFLIILTVSLILMLSKKEVP